MAGTCSECNASTTNNNIKLYQCTFVSCNVKNVCQSCGTFSHKRRDHDFSGVMAPIETINENQNAKQSQTCDDQNSTFEKEIPESSEKKEMCTSAFSQSPQDIACGSVAAASAATAIFGASALITGAGAAFGAFASLVYAPTIRKGIQHLMHMDYRTPSHIVQQKECQIKALKIFQFEEEDVTNENIFNMKEVESTYRRLAKFYHPDKGPQHRRKSFRRVEISRRILLSMIEPQKYAFPDDGYQLIHEDKNVANSENKAIAAAPTWF